MSTRVNNFERYYARLSATSQLIANFVLQTEGLKNKAKVELPLDVSVIGAFRGTEIIPEGEKSPTEIKFDYGSPKTNPEHPGWIKPPEGVLQALIEFGEDSYRAYQSGSTGISIQKVDLSIKGQINTSSEILNDILASGFEETKSGLMMMARTLVVSEATSVAPPLIFEALVPLGKTDNISI